MTPEQFNRVESIFERAVELPIDERAGFIRAAAAGDATIITKVEGMLARDAGDYLSTPAMGVNFHVGSPEAIERSLLDEFTREAHFHVLSKIGEGGFGTVYRAEQLQPVRRIVALKVIKLGMDTRQVVARFEAERQTLAMMDHPGIARVYEAGATPSGRPYFAMELVDGVPITHYCDAARSTIRQRLELFLGVCRAVQHAHQKGIIHRDLKPSNVLVVEHDGQPLPKIIDFGIARAFTGIGAGDSGMTMQGQPVGTPAHMSPEQAAGERDIDTRTDVYSLGVLLYELLTGSPTLLRSSVDGLSPAAVVRLVRESQPQRPSQRAAALAENDAGHEIARRRAMEPASLVRRLRGDLDCIIMTALEKDRARRYGTADAFATDIARHLVSEPISAHPPTTMYRVAKFARRNRPVIAVVALVLFALLTTSMGLIRSRRAESRARIDAQIAQEVNAFLNDDLLAAVAPEELGSEVKVLDVLNRASDAIEGRFVDQPAVEAAVRLTLGRTFLRIASFKDAEKHLTRAHELRVSLFGANDVRTLEALHELGKWRWMTERYDLAEGLLRQAYHGRLALLGPDNPETLSSQYFLAVAIGEQGRYNETEPLMLEALRRSRSALGSSNKLTLELLLGLAVLYEGMSDPERCLATYEESYALSRRHLGPSHPTTMLANKGLAKLLIERGETDRPLQLLTESIEASRKVRGDAHPGTLVLMAILARLHAADERPDEAESVIRKAITAAHDSLPVGHTVTTRLELTLAEIYDAQGRYDLAEPKLVEAVDQLRRKFGPENPLTMQAVNQLIKHYTDRGRPDDAEKVKQGRR